MDPLADKVDILGSEISRVDLDMAIKKIEGFISDARKHFVVLPAVHTVLLARKDSELRQAHNSADLAPADGVPLIWASKLLGKPIQGRVTGLDLLPRFCEIAAKKGYTFFLMGAGPGVAQKLASVLMSQYPGLKIAGTYTPPFCDEFSTQENDRIISEVNTKKPDLLWVSLTSPKQQKWVFRNIENLNVKVAIAIGGAFDVCCGNVKRAPVWMRNNGLEWFYRFLQEPRRLFKRYFVDALPFFPLILLQRSKLIWNR
jgi:N-acetylglucosaminyldiphosphoundecaprenol N-acetyl-beta-D-mannosaminyltransferase